MYHHHPSKNNTIPAFISSSNNNNKNSKAQLSRLDMNVTKADLTHTIHLRSNFRKDAIVNFLHVPENNPTIGRLVGCS